jgi:DNA-binding transcriptional LysR family regulator
VAQVRAVLPQLEISLRVAEREDALPMLRQGMLDVAVVEAHDFPTGGALHGGVVWNGLLSDPFRIVMPRGHPLARRRIIKLQELSEESWIDVRCEIGCCRAATDAAFHQAGFVPRRAFEADEYWPAQGFIAAGLGVALIPAVALGIIHPGVIVRRLEHTTQPVRQVLAATRPALASTVPVQAMITALQSVAAVQRRALDPS